MKKCRTAAILGLSVFFLVCSKAKNPVTGSGEDPSGFRFESSQSNCGGGSGESTGGGGKGDTVIFSSHGDTILVWFNGDTVWVMHKNAFENCCSEIQSDVQRTPEGFDIYEYDTAMSPCNCLCYFDLVTTIYGVLPGVYLIRVFDTRGELVDEVELEIPST